MSIDPEHLGYFRDLVYKQSGIVLGEGKDYLIEARLTALSRTESIDGPNELLRKLTSTPYGLLHFKAVEAMTTNETSFFRDIHPFEALRKTVLPEIVARNEKTRRVRIWCAAASSGQEPYSIAISIREHFPELADWNVEIVGTDLSPEMLKRCEEASYTQLEVNRGLPAALLVKHFEKDGAHWKVKPELRQLLKLQEMNLTKDWPGLPRFDLVFMRNVLIYFDVDTKKTILAKTRKLMEPGALLFLGGAETTVNIDDAFERVQFEKSAAYRVREGQ